jgi:hypothetical protein
MLQDAGKHRETGLYTLPGPAYRPAAAEPVARRSTASQAAVALPCCELLAVGAIFDQLYLIKYYMVI